MKNKELPIFLHLAILNLIGFFIAHIFIILKLSIPTCLLGGMAWAIFYVDYIQPQINKLAGR